MKRLGVFFILLLIIAGCTTQSSSAEDDYLYYLCKVWGFLKYHHPAVAAGNYDWDEELFAMVEQTHIAENREKRNLILSEWVEKLGPVVSVETKTDDTINYKQAPDYEWINKRELGNNLAALLTDIKYSIPADSNCYVNFDYAHSAGQPQFENEKKYPDIEPWNDYHYRLLTLFRTWNAIEYLFPYKYLTDKPWDSILREYMPLFRTAETRPDFLKALLLFTAEICDGHTWIYSDGHDIVGEALGIVGQRWLPCEIKYVEGKYIVARTFSEGELLRGDVLLTIDNMNVDSLAYAMKPYIPSPNDDYYCGLIRWHLGSTPKDSVVLAISRNDIISEITTCTISKIDYRQALNNEPVGFRMLGDSIGYINVGNFGLSQIDTTFQNLSSTKGLILDMREYPKEFIIYYMGYYLIDGELPFAKYVTTDYEHLGTYGNESLLTVGMNNPDYYKGSVVILVDINTMSQGEFTTMAWSLAPKATVIGSRTAGSDGDVTLLPLPGDLTLSFTGNGVYYPDGGETQRVGIRIDEEVRPTIQGIREGRDELLEKAIQIINQQPN